MCFVRKPAGGQNLLQKIDSQDETITWFHPEDFAFALEPTPDANHSPPATSSHSADPAGGIKEELEFFFHPTIFNFCWCIEQEFQPHLDAGIKKEFQFFFNPTRSEDAAWTVQYTHRYILAWGSMEVKLVCINMNLVNYIIEDWYTIL